MLRSLFAGVSGMKSNQVKMDTIGNNIANVNTIAYKGSTITFKDMLSQTMQGASAPSEGRGGMDPKQIGLGVAVASVSTNMGQGGLQPTGKATDFAIEGNGFFILAKMDPNNPGQVADQRFTRDGSFTLDKAGNLVTSEGYYVRGKSFLPNTEENIKLDAQLLAPIKIGGFDLAFTLGNELTGYTINATDSNLPLAVNVDTGTSQITITGDFDNSASQGFTLDDLADMINTQLQANGIGQRVRVGGAATEDIGAGVTHNIPTDTANISSFGVEADGSIRAIYDDKILKVGQLVIANFQNPAGLSKMGGNTYKASLNSGNAVIDTPKGDVNIHQGILEMSNVDLANEFTDMIITSRAFQANSRTITTSDEMLQELLNLKR